MNKNTDNINLRPSCGGKCWDIYASAGWALENCRMGMQTDRGRSTALLKPKPHLGLLHSLHFKRISNGALEIWQTLENLSGRQVLISEIETANGVLDLAGNGWMVMHSELFKTEKYFGGYSCYTGNLFAPLPGLEGEFGLSEDTPFPGIFFMHPERGAVLMATLTQARCKPVWKISAEGRNVRIEARDYFAGIPAIPLEGGEKFETERWLILSGSSAMPELIDAYYDLLRKRIDFPGRISALRAEMVWGSWNLNIRPGGHGDIDEAYILSNARALQKMHNKVRWIMIDDGYQRRKPRRPGIKGGFFSSHYMGVDMFDPALDTPHDPARFPQGMKCLAADIQKIGMKPAIWCTPLVAADGPLVKRHPEWEMRISGRRRFLDPTTWLDYSIPEVRDYTRRAWDAIFNQWGYKGLKLDFWTYPFEIPGVQFHDRTRTAIEWRNEFLADIRAHVPPGGFLLTCCTVNAGNPFLGRFADASRMGPDIGSGTWDAVRSAAMWVSAAALFYRGDCLLADPDSIGWCPALNETENRAWATTALMSAGMCEIGGDMAHLIPEAKKLLDAVNRFWRPAGRSVNEITGPWPFDLPSKSWRLERPDDCWQAQINWRKYPLQGVLKSRSEFWSAKPISPATLLPEHSAVLIKS
ncbi:MAG: alpha-galactosidase [Verrucomicrobiota bacterium]